MISAMPTVKPSMTGSGTSAMNRPALTRPAAARMIPARSVARSSPSKPYCSTIPATTTMNAPVGPPIWTLLPPSKRDQNAPDDGRDQPRLWRRSGRDRYGDAERKATSATVTPARDRRGRGARNSLSALLGASASLARARDGDLFQRQQPNVCDGWNADVGGCLQSKYLSRGVGENAGGLDAG